MMEQQYVFTGPDLGWALPAKSGPVCLPTMNVCRYLPNRFELASFAVRSFVELFAEGKHYWLMVVVDVVVSSF